MISVTVEQVKITVANVLSTGEFDQAIAYCVEWAESRCQGRQMACYKGCAHCCVLNVSVLVPEAIRIGNWIIRQLSDTEQASVMKRLHDHACWVRWMDDEERIFRRAYCPLLADDGSCMVYPVRPLVCRGVTALDQLQCRDAFEPVPEDITRSVQTDLLRRMVYEQVFSILGEALKQQHLDGRSLELGTGVLLCMQTPKWADQYRRGEQVARELP